MDVGFVRAFCSVKFGGIFEHDFNECKNLHVV